MMRRCWAFILIAHLAATVSVHAEEPAQPRPLDGICPVPVDDRWTPQEKYVWQQVCVGNPAVFAPEKSGAPSDSHVLSSGFLETILLKDKYRQALTRFGVEIVGARFTEQIDLQQAELEHNLFLVQCVLEKGANFMGLRSAHTLLLGNSTVSASLDMTELQVGYLFIKNAALTDVNLGDAHVDDRLYLTGSSIAGRLDMGGLHVGGDLFISGSKFAGQLNMNAFRVRGHLSMDKAAFTDVELSAADVGGQLILDGSTVTGQLNMPLLHVEGDLHMNNVNASKVTLNGAHVGGALALVGSKIAGQLDLSILQAGSLFMNGKAEFAEVKLIDAHVGDKLSLASSKVSGELDMNELRVGGDLSLSHAELAEVNLTAAGVGSEIDLTGSKITGVLNMNTLQARELMMYDNAEFKEVKLIGAHIGDHLSLNGSKVTNTLNMNGLQVGGDLLMRGAEFASIDLTTANVGGQLTLVGSKVSGPLTMDGLQVGEHLTMQQASLASLELETSHVAGGFNLTGSKIAGSFRCYALEVVQEIDMSEAEFSGLIDCQKVKIKGDLKLGKGKFIGNVNLAGAEIGGTLHLDGAQWDRNGTLDLRDAKIERIPALSGAWAEKQNIDGFTYRTVDAPDQFASWFARLTYYTPQPYYQLASVVESQGNVPLATAIRYSGRDAERKEARGLSWIWLTILRSLIGYGYYPQWAIFWALALVLGGAVVMRISEEGPRNGMPYGVAYSFDLLLPIIRLREKHYQIDLQTWWARYYFYGHKVMGYVLASFLIAAISGLTK
jgi:hypothetical protein